MTCADPLHPVPRCAQSTEKDLLERDVWNVDQRLEVMNGQLERAHNARTGKYGPGHLLWSKKRQEKKSEDGASSAGDEMSDVRPAAHQAGTTPLASSPPLTAPRPAQAEKRITQEIQEQERIKRIALSEAQSREIRIVRRPCIPLLPTLPLARSVQTLTRLPVQRNVEDEMKQIEEELRLETGELARRVHIQRPLRAVAFNKMNAQTSDVFGTETAGVELFAATMHSDVAFYDLETAVCMSVLGGGDPSRLQAEGRNGHPQAITAVHFTSDILITGDVSGAIRTWILADTLAHEAAEVDDQAGEEESKKKKKKKQAGGKRQEGNHAARPPGNVRVELDYEVRASLAPPPFLHPSPLLHPSPHLTRYASAAAFPPPSAPCVTSRTSTRCSALWRRRTRRGSTSCWRGTRGRCGRWTRRTSEQRTPAVHSLARMDPL